ncbi:MAG: purine-binding chemotaxis protein CheW [Gammaproteobacteria bacterium]|nr:purine-binding chemotaxis protein CheW [Gammaproteobacteria bacterium]
MLFLLFQLGNDRYALDVASVAEVLPLVDLKQIPQAPLGVAGVFNYRGAPVPAIDLSQLTLGHAAPRRLSTRLILVRYPDDAGAERLLGLIAERTTQTVRRQPSEFVDTGVSQDGASYLGPVATDAHGLIQWIEVRKLLPASVRDVLFKQPVANA